MIFYHTLALRNLSKRKIRTSLSALGILLGIAMIVSLVSVSDGLQRLTDDLSRTMGTNILVIQKGVNPATGGYGELDAKVIDNIEKIPGVLFATPLVVGTVEIEDYRSSIPFVGGIAGIIGVDPDKERRSSSEYTKVVAGRSLKSGETDGVLVGIDIVRDSDIKVGSTINVKLVNGENKGEVYEFNVVGIYELGSSGANDLVIDIEQARKMLSMPSYKISFARAVPENPAQSEEIERKIKMLVPGVDPSFGRMVVKQLSSFTDTLRVATWVIAGLAAIIGGIGIANSMIMSVAERTKEFGILKAVGWKSSEIVLLVITECLIISSFGALMGIGLGLFVSYGLLPKLVGGTFVPYVGVFTIVEAFFFALFLGVLGGILPARRAAGLDPVEAFRAE
ncbi:MAG: FtsX-like permease family protein [archaeon]